MADFLHNDAILGWAYLRLSNYYFNNITQKIVLLQKALLFLEKAGDLKGQGEVVLLLCSEFAWKGNYEEAFHYCEKALSISQKMKLRNINSEEDLVLPTLLKMAELYEEVGDNKTAMDYLTEAKNYSLKNKLEWDFHDAMGQLFNKMGKYDSAYYYLKMNLDAAPNSRYAKMLLGENYLVSKQFEKAIKLFKECDDSLNMQKYWSRVLFNLGHAYEGQGNFNSALVYAKKGMSLENRAKQTLEGYELLSRIYHGLRKNDSSYFYLQQHDKAQDSITNPQFLWGLNNKLYNYQRSGEDQKKVTAIALLQKDNLLKEQLLKEQNLLKEKQDVSIQLLDKDNKLTQQQLKQEALLKKQKEEKIALLDKDNRIKQQKIKQEALIKYLLTACLIIILLAGYFIHRNLSLKRKNEKLESDKKNAELQHRASELEMQALRAQMNPHFIFNCLNSINKYILKNETEAASDYLTRFSRLIRMVLINSQKSLITLEEELDMLRHYLDMERLRFNNTFDYNINFINAIEPAAVFIPPLLLLPFCENAIWHGLMHKEGHGKLDIALSIQGDILSCTITDNGVGREKAAEWKSKSAERQKSMGLNITNHRLALLNQGGEEDNYFELHDIMEAEGKIGGTRVDIRIGYKNLIDDVTS